MRHILTAVLVIATLTLTFVRVDSAAHPAAAAAIEVTAFTPAPGAVGLRGPSEEASASARLYTQDLAAPHLTRLAPLPAKKPVASSRVAAPTPSPSTTVSGTVVEVASGYGCDPALSYLAAHAAPGFAFECPGYALGHQAMTCIDVAGVCPDSKLIAINDPCPAAYMNEASNSWVLEGLRSAPIDPYGYCH